MHTAHATRSRRLFVLTLMAHEPLPTLTPRNTQLVAVPRTVPMRSPAYHPHVRPTKHFPNPSRVQRQRAIRAARQQSPRA